MNTSILRYIYFTTIVTFCSLYGAQPIQPLFKSEFHLSSFQAILFTTLMMAPLGFAPLVYGYILESFSARVMARWALLLLGLLEFCFSLAGNYFSLLCLRGLQGLLIPAILTSIMSYVSYTAAREQVQQAIAAYIAATILGGFLGRFLSGLCADLFGWRVFFFILGGLLIGSAVLLGGMTRDAKMHYARPKLAELAGLFRRGEFFWLYLSIFCLFFVFAAMMNFLPFELKRLNPHFHEAGIGILYLGYSMGIVVSLSSRKIIAAAGNVVDAIGAGIVIFIAGTMIFFIENHVVMFFAMFVFCAGLFTAHSLLSGLVNTLAQDNKAIANGLYMSFYYTGGTLGSVLPGAVFERFGWRPFLVQLLVMILLALFLTRRLRRAIAAR